MDFEAIDGQPVRLIVLLASPPDRTSDHIQALARVSRLMTMDEFREREFDRLADIVRASLDMDFVYRVLRGEA